MPFSSQELLLTLGFVGFFYLISIVGLVHVHRSLGFPHLKFAAFALVLELFRQGLLITGALQDSNLLLFASIPLKFLSIACIFVAVMHVLKRAVPLVPLLALLLLVPVLGIAGSFLPLSGQDHWLLAEGPGILLLLAGVYFIFRLDISTSTGFLFLATMLVVHTLALIAMTQLDRTSTAFLAAYSAGLLSLLGACGAFAVICSEWILLDLAQQRERLALSEQENRRLELQFSQAQKLESLGLLAGGIAHDFNNMLTSILGYTSVAIKKLPPDSEVRKDLYMVMSGARQAVDLTSQMLMYAGKGAIEFESLDLSRVVDNMSGLVNSIVPPKIHLVNRISGDLPYVRGDAVKLGQVIMNLVANSVDAIEDQGDIEISTGVSEVNESLLSQCLFSQEREPGSYVYLRIRDTGSGMAAEEIARIFDPFYSGKDESRGLGLSSLSGIVRQHKGFIHVESAPGEGAVFTVYLPILAFRDALPPGSRTAGSRPAGKGRVLLADDDSRIRSLIASILESDNFELVSVEDGREALRTIHEDGASYDAFVLDCTMPKLSGTEVYRDIRSSGLNKPVILVSGYHQEQVIADIGRDPNAYFIKKPFSVDVLLETVNAAIARSRHQESSISPLE